MPGDGRKSIRMLRIWQFKNKAAPKQPGIKSQMQTCCSGHSLLLCFFSHCLALLKGHVEMQSEKCVLSAVSKHLTASCH